MPRNRRPTAREIARGRALRLWQERQLLNPSIDADDDMDATPVLPAVEVATARMEASAWTR